MRSPSDQTLWDSLPIPVFITDDAGRIFDANAAAEQFLNLPARRLAGQNLQGVLCGDPSLPRALKQVSDHAGPAFLNNVSLLAGDTKQGANIQLGPLAEQTGRLVVLVQPRSLSGNLDHGVEVKSAARSAIGMAEMLVHEIKNPLAGITGAAQLLAMSLPQEDRELTGLIVAESRRIVGLLDQVEQFGNTQEPSCKTLNIHDLLDRAQKSAEVGFASHMQFKVEYDPSLPLTFVDGDQMIQVFLNLMKNAAEAAGQHFEKDATRGGMITLKTFYDHAMRLRGADGKNTHLPLQVEIIDNGPGIAPDIIRQVFEPFISGRENGTGLGLALVSKIISDHGAWISVDSRPGKCAFRISLPIAKKGAT